MKYALAASMLALGLAACGGGGGAKGEFVEACVKESGESKETCECQANAMEEALGKSDFNKFVKIVSSDDEEAGEKLMMDIIGKNPEAGMKMGMAMLACAG